MRFDYVLMDLGFEDAKELTAKAALTLKLNQLLERRGLNQMEAAAITGMTQPKVSQVRRYKLQNISLERLMQALVSLDQHVEIVVQPVQAFEHMPCIGLQIKPTLQTPICYNQGMFMRTVSIFRNGKNQAVRLPKDMEFEGITELEIIREGDAVILRPARPGWLSLADLPAADTDFLEQRPVVVDDEGRFTL